VSSGRASHAVAVALTAGALLVAAAPAAAAPARGLCVDRVALRDAPGGFAIAHLRRPQRLVVLDRTAGGRWSLVRARRTGTQGWLVSAVLCAPSR